MSSYTQSSSAQAWGIDRRGRHSTSSFFAECASLNRTKARAVIQKSSQLSDRFMTRVTGIFLSHPVNCRCSQEADMAFRTWQIDKIKYCEHVGHEIASKRKSSIPPSTCPNNRRASLPIAVPTPPLVTCSTRPCANGAAPILTTIQCKNPHLSPPSELA